MSRGMLLVSLVGVCLAFFAAFPVFSSRLDNAWWHVLVA